MPEYTETNRSIIRRYPERGSYDKEQLLRIIGKNFIAQVGFEENGQPFIIPMNYCNDDDYIYFHGSKESRLMKILGSGKPIVVSILNIKGIVIRTKVTENSIHYVSAIIFGNGIKISNSQKKIEIFKIMMERMVKGRWEDTYPPTQEDLDNVEVVALKIEDFSIKINLKEPKEIEESDKWYGILPIETIFGNPISNSSSNVPEYIRKLAGKSVFE